MDSAYLARQISRYLRTGFKLAVLGKSTVSGASTTYRQKSVPIKQKTEGLSGQVAIDYSRANW